MCTTKQVTFSDLVLISHSQADNLIREKWPLKQLEPIQHKKFIDVVKVPTDLNKFWNKNKVQFQTYYFYPCNYLDGSHKISIMTKILCKFISSPDWWRIRKRENDLGNLKKVCYLQITFIKSQFCSQITEQTQCNLMHILS